MKHYVGFNISKPMNCKLVVLFFDCIQQMLVNLGMPWDGCLGSKRHILVRELLKWSIPPLGYILSVPVYWYRSIYF